MKSSNHENIVEFLRHPLPCRFFHTLFIFLYPFFRFQLLFFFFFTAFTTYEASVSPFKSFYWDSRKYYFFTLSERIKWSITQTQSSAGSNPRIILIIALDWREFHIPREISWRTLKVEVTHCFTSRCTSSSLRDLHPRWH